MKNNIKNNWLKQKLLQPVHVNKLESITNKNNILISSQKYHRAFDPDMSDLAINFYEIIYQNILPKDINNNINILKETDLSNKLFAGDTMNSFNTISGKVIQKLKIKNIYIKNIYPMPKDSEERLKLILESDADAITKKVFTKFFNLYHSLANFWILPMSMGRTSLKNIPLPHGGGQQDYMVRFLKEVQSNWDSLIDENISECYYFKNFDNYDNFLEAHFIEKDSYQSSFTDETEIKNSLTEIDDVKIVENLISAIEQRAEKISTSQYAQKLENYFNSI